MRKTQDFHLGRVLRLPVPVSVICAVNFFVLPIDLMCDLETVVAPVVLWETLAVIKLVVLAVEVALVIWCLGVNNIRGGCCKLPGLLIERAKRLIGAKSAVRPAAAVPSNGWA
eukprot:scaffold506730_cov45-Prasinocladus_malaysianus.AAC.1